MRGVPVWSGGVPIAGTLAPIAGPNSSAEAVAAEAVNSAPPSTKVIVQASKRSDANRIDKAASHKIVVGGILYHTVQNYSSGSNSAVDNLFGSFQIEQDPVRKHDVADEMTEVWIDENVSRRDAMGLGIGAAALAATPKAAFAAETAVSKDQGRPAAQGKPVLVFDVNETLLDIDVLNPIFDRIFGVPGRMREWFAQLILYSQSISLAGRYAPFGALGAGVLRMLGTVHGVAIRDEDLNALRTALATLPVHAEAPNALRRLSAAGFRMVTLTNTPPGQGPDALSSAGLGDLFQQRFTIEPVRRFKPAPETYRLVTDSLRVPPAAACMIAAHTWDTLGAQSAGWSAALVTRSVNAVLDAPDVPKPDIVGADLTAVANQIIERWG